MFGHVSGADGQQNDFQNSVYMFKNFNTESPVPLNSSGILQVQVIYLVVTERLILLFHAKWNGMFK